jgi:hypothetical protein
VASIGGLAGGAALAGCLVEDDGSGGGDVEGADAAGHGDAEQMVAGAADEVVETGALAAEDENAVAGEVELVVVGGAALVEADDPDVLLLQFFEGANEVDDAGDAEMFGGSRAGFYGDRTERCGAAFGEDYSIDAGAIGYAEKCAEILRIFDTVKGEEQAGLRGIRRCEEVFNGQRFLRADESHDALVSRSTGQMREVFAGFLTYAHAGLSAFRDEAREAVVVALGGYHDVIEATAASLECFGNRVYAVENIHGISVDGACYGCDLRRATTRQLSMALAARRSRPYMVWAKKMPSR